MHLFCDLRELREALLDLAFPRSCLGCEKALEQPDPWANFCETCVERFDFIHPPVCRTCGHPFLGMGAFRSCDRCEAIDPFFEEGRCCLLHRDIAALLVREIKYHDGRYLRPDLVAVMRRTAGLAAYLDGTVLVPVPLHPARERERGFNQSRWLAECFAEAAMSNPPVCDLLRRTLWTGSQTRLSRAERGKNVSKAFALAPGVALDLGQTYVIIDDVFTTGSTLNECARVLHAAGATRLKVLTLAHG